MQLRKRECTEEQILNVALKLKAVNDEIAVGSVGTTDHRRCTHGGRISFGFAAFLRLNREFLGDVGCCAHYAELGVGAHAAFITLSAATQPRQVNDRVYLGIECDDHRYGRVQMVMQAVRRRFPELPLPDVRKGKFEENAKLEELVGSQRALKLFLNNAGGALHGTGTEEALERILTGAAVGSKVVCFSRMFEGDNSWDEKGYELLSLGGDHVSWRQGSNGKSSPFPVFTYTKLSSCPTRRRPRRGSLAMKQIPFPNNQLRKLAL